MANYIEIYDVNNTIVSGTPADDSIWAGGVSEYVTVSAGAGNDTVWGGSYHYIDGQGDDDYLYANAYSTLIGGTGNDSLLLFYSGNSYAFGGDGNDSLVTGGNQYEYTTLDGGAGDDYISNVNIRTSISGGAGNDSIYNDPYTSALTITGGTGDDTITLSNGGGNVVQYNSGDGNDIIIGFNYTHDTLQIAADSYSTTSTAGSDDFLDVIVQVGDGSITLKDAVRSEYLSYLDLKISGAGIVGDNILQKVDNAYTYTGGTATIQSYASEKVNFNTDFAGFGFNDTGFMLNSSSGTLTIKNARDKVIDVAVGGNTVAYAYLASYAGAINGGGISQLEVIIGANDGANVLTAGDGGSSLWGGSGSYGSGSYDTLTGGAGIDTFFWGKNDGSDVIANASSNDLINLYDVSLDNIISAKTEGNEIYVRFDTGCDLLIESSENLSATFKLADGNFKFNHSSGEWQSA